MLKKRKKKKSFCAQIRKYIVHFTYRPNRECLWQSPRAQEIALILYLDQREIVKNRRLHLDVSNDSRFGCDQSE